MPTDPAKPADEELLTRWRAGDSRAGEALFHRYYDRVERFFKNKISLGVEDLVQETFRGCVEGVPGLRDASRFRAYLYRVAENVLCSHLRKRYGRGRETAFDDMSIEDLAPGPVTIMAKSGEQELLLLGLRRIPFRLQLILELHYWEDKTTEDIAEILDIPRGTVKSRIRRGRELLAEAIRTLDESPELIERTISNLDDWIATCRALLASLGGQGGA